MTLYSIHARTKDAMPQAVAEKFSWFAALLPPVHALVHRLWVQLMLSVTAPVALVFSAPVIGPAAMFWLYVLFAVAMGFAASGARQRALHRRGYHFLTYRVDVDADLARLSVLENRA